MSLPQLNQTIQINHPKYPGQWLVIGRNERAQTVKVCAESDSKQDRKFDVPLKMILEQ